MKWLRHSALAVAVAAAVASAPASAQWSSLVFFGDSLTDAGSFAPVLPPGTGRFTTNPGEVWAQLLGSRYGFTITPANQGGTDYAQGGARITQLPGYPSQAPTGNAVPIATQIQQATARGIDPNALYVVWGGANDIFTGLAALSAGQINATQLQGVVAQAATQEVQQVATLSAAGARYIAVINMPDIGRTPSGLSQGAAGAAQLTAISGLYNNTLQGGLAASGVQVIPVNIFAFFNEITANPGLYGFTNATLPACGTTASLVCTPANLVAAGAAQNYVFADSVHPTTGGHTVIAQYVASMLEGPAQIAALAEAPIAVERANFRTIDGRMWSALGTPYDQTRRYNAWASYDYGSVDLGGSPFLTGDSNLNTVAVGIDMRLDPSMLVGIGFGYTRTESDFGNGTGGFDLDETTLTAYAGWGYGPWYAGLSLMLGDLQYNDVHRNITLGAATRTESGDANGWHYAARLVGGYWFNAGSLLHGPFAKIGYQEARVRSFAENGQSSTALIYGEQKREALTTSLGWQVQGTFGMVRPWARVSWEHDANADDRAVTASSVTLGGRYQVPAFKPDDSWYLFELGAATDFGRVTGYISGSATTSKGDGDGYGITLGIRVPL